MQKDIIKVLKSIHFDLCDSADKNKLDLFQSAVDRLNELIKQLSTQEPSTASEGESVAVLEGVDYWVEICPVNSKIMRLTRRV